MQEVIEFTTALMEDKTHAYAERQAARKRKYALQAIVTGNHTPGLNLYVPSVITIMKVQCAPKCYKCNKYGHIARDCRGTRNANNNNNQKGTGSGQKPTCF
ncbi:putative reverse transcriptase domain-containing protein, partial [Tanacetum coccineum]